jgi:hypothetical protein
MVIFKAQNTNSARIPQNTLPNVASQRVPAAGHLIVMVLSGYGKYLSLSQYGGADLQNGSASAISLQTSYQVGRRTQYSKRAPRTASNPSEIRRLTKAFGWRAHKQPTTGCRDNGMEGYTVQAHFNEPQDLRRWFKAHVKQQHKRQRTHVLQEDLSP